MLRWHFAVPILCAFVAVNKADVTNHTHQKHMLPHKSVCQFCKQFFINRLFFVFFINTIIIVVARAIKYLHK